MSLKIFLSTKTYDHSLGISACFRQWRASHSHCKYLHGYALKVKLTFIGTKGLDEHNWVVDFGGLKEIKNWIKGQFDHKTIVASDDPELELFKEMQACGILELNILPAVGCEKFAEHIFDYVDRWIASKVQYDKRVVLATVEVSEHSGNSAIVSRATNSEEA